MEIGPSCPTRNRSVPARRDPRAIVAALARARSSVPGAIAHATSRIRCRHCGHVPDDGSSRARGDTAGPRSVWAHRHRAWWFPGRSFCDPRGARAPSRMRCSSRRVAADHAPLRDQHRPVRRSSSFQATGGSKCSDAHEIWALVLADPLHRASRGRSEIHREERWCVRTRLSATRRADSTRHGGLLGERQEPSIAGVSGRT